MQAARPGQPGGAVAFYARSRRGTSWPASPELAAARDACPTGLHICWRPRAFRRSAAGLRRPVAPSQVYNLNPQQMSAAAAAGPRRAAATATAATPASVLQNLEPGRRARKARRLSGSHRRRHRIGRSRRHWTTGNDRVPPSGQGQRTHGTFLPPDVRRHFACPGRGLLAIHQRGVDPNALGDHRR